MNRQGGPPREAGELEHLFGEIVDVGKCRSGMDMDEKCFGRGVWAHLMREPELTASSLVERPMWAMVPRSGA